MQSDAPEKSLGPGVSRGDAGAAVREGSRDGTARDGSGPARPRAAEARRGSGAAAARARLPRHRRVGGSSEGSHTNDQRHGETDF